MSETTISARRLSRAAQEMFDRLRIPQEMIEQAEVESIDDSEARERFGFTRNGDGSGICFPYFRPDGSGHRATHRIRRNHPEIENGKPRNKYFSAFGDHRHLYFPPNADVKLRDPQTQIVIVESEKAALAVQALFDRCNRNVLTVATGGCWGWRGRIGKTVDVSGGRVDEIGPLPDLAYSFGRTVYVLFDSNAAINADVRRARRELKKYLREKQCEVRILDLPQGQWNGPDDFLEVCGDEALAELFNSPQLIVQDLVEFKEEEFPAQEPLLVLAERAQTVVLKKRSLVEIFAYRGTGKTMVAYSIASALASGRPFLNLNPIRKARVLYVEGETPNAQMQERARLLASDIEPGFFYLITLENQKHGIPALGTAEGRKCMQETIERISGVEVVFLDSISTLAWFATNDEEEWLDFLAWIARLRSQGLCVVFLHHAGKGGMQRGHSRAEDMLDVVIKLARPSESEEKDHLALTWTYEKFRGDREGIRSLGVEFLNGSWFHHTLEEEKLSLLRSFMADNPGATNRDVAKALPQIGSATTIWRMQRENNLLPVKMLKQKPKVKGAT